MTVTSIFASTLSGGIGRSNKLPWSIKKDLQNFEHVTSSLGRGASPNGVLMGRRTWQSLPKKPLASRLNCVVTSRPEDVQGAAEIVRSVREGISALNSAGCSTVYITGGKGVYDIAHQEKLSEYVVWTRVCGPKVNCDVQVDIEPVLANYTLRGLCKTQAAGKHTFDIAFYRLSDLQPTAAQNAYERSVLAFLESVTNSGPTKSLSFLRLCSPGSGDVLHRGHEEFQYLDIMRDIIDTGVQMDDRTGVGTISKFGAIMRFDLSQTFPLLTTKRVFWKGAVEELLWFLRGDTDSLKLSDAGVHIWDGNGSREFLDNRGLHHRREGDLGPVYGFQWRHFGAPYATCETDYTGKGVDQIKELIEGIKKDPTSRRHIVSAWNPLALRDMALPPCHVLCQFVVEPIRGELSCCLYQRSGDWGLGIPFNIASYSLLCMIVAKLTGLRAKEFVHYVANAHVYSNHVEPLREQLTRTPRPFPRVVIKDGVHEIDALKKEHIQLIGYEPYPAIKMEMAV